MNESEEEKEFGHIGIVRRSGRYPWGSGGDPYQNSKSFKTYLTSMEKQGMTPTQIAEAISAFSGEKFSTTNLRENIAISTEMLRTENIQRARNLAATGMSPSAIGREMGENGRVINESTIRGWLRPGEEAKANSIRAIANAIKEHSDTKPYLDVGAYNHLSMGVSSTKFKNALALLREEGYNTYQLKTPQQGTGEKTTLLVLTKPDVTWNDARLAVERGELKLITSTSDDGGATFLTPSKAMPVSVSSKKIEVRHAEDGGAEMDGVIELRRGVEELSLGGARYAQVRIAVDGSHYLKGMAIYADNLPPGVDMRFNTNKTKAETGGSKLKAMKPMKTELGTENIDPNNPFGSQAKPRMYVDKNGKEHQSPLNIVNEEGDWDKWSRTLSSQMLSKQPIALASKQLAKTREAREKDLHEILAMNNPVVKQKLLDEFAETADAAAVHLKAAADDRVSNHVILPTNSVRRHEIYAPNFDNGEKVSLVRHPHGGPFEIPELTVNNLNRGAQKIMKGARDAVGIHHSVAAILSGADFDGDTVLVIPNNKGEIRNRPPLKDLEGFDPKAQYKIPDDDTTTTRMTKKNTQTEMGRISNLITDMTVKGANDTEIARAVKHSMVVIDAEKHGLNYKQSEKDNNIAALKKTYQSPNRGASTIISKASSEASRPQTRKLSGKGAVDPKTGEKIIEFTGRTYVDKNGKTVAYRDKGTKMEFAKDAFELTSKPARPIEEVYASHANGMKALANRARKESVALVMPHHSPAAKSLYRKEVDSLDAALKVALKNAPLERLAQTYARTMAKAKIDDNPQLDKEEIKKIRGQALVDARLITGAGKTRIHLSESQWAAIQAGAISASKFRDIMRNADMDRVKELANPKYRGSLTPGQLARAHALQASGRSPTEIAERLGIPRSTVVNNLAIT